MTRGRQTLACSACKHQRRECKPDCPLAPYFPPNQEDIFQCAKQLFGVSRILRTLQNANDYQKDKAMTAIKYESYMRKMNPVIGCCGVIQDLKHQIFCVKQELELLKQQLEVFRQNHGEQYVQSILPLQRLPDNVGSPRIELGATAPIPNNNIGHPLYNESQQACGASFPADFRYGNHSAMWRQSPQQDYGYNINGFENSITNQSQVPNQQQEMNVQYHEMHPFFQNIDMQSYNGDQDYEPRSHE